MHQNSRQRLAKNGRFECHLKQTKTTLFNSTGDGLWTYSTNKDFLTKLSRTCTTEIFFILTFKRNIFVHISRHSYLLSDDIKDFPDLWLPYQKMASVSMSVIFSTWASKVMLSAPPDINTLVHNNIQSCCSVSNYWFAQKIKYIEYF